MLHPVRPVADQTDALDSAVADASAAPVAVRLVARVLDGCPVSCRESVLGFRLAFQGAMAFPDAVEQSLVALHSVPPLPDVRRSALVVEAVPVADLVPPVAAWVSRLLEFHLAAQLEELAESE